MNRDEIKFDARLDLVPQSPGVYLMKDSSGLVIYVGKAKNLKNRLGSYFVANPKGSPKVLAMISHIASFDFLECANETEAFLLECNLIKEYRPKYNILLTDDREYPYIKITMNEAFPRVMKAYRIDDDIKEGALFYGPYLNGVLNKALDTFKDFFPVRNCNLKLPEDIGKRRPCLNYYIGKCSGACAGLISQEDYMKDVQGIMDFLGGRYEGILEKTTEMMHRAAEEQKFERAAVLRDRVFSLRKLMTRQAVAVQSQRDIDVFGYALGQSESCIIKLEVRSGRLTASSTFFTQGLQEDFHEEFMNILLRHLHDSAFIAKEVFIPGEIEDAKILAQALSSIKGSKVTVRTPLRGIGVDLMKMAEKNAGLALRRKVMISAGTSYSARATLEKLSEILFGVPDLIRRIEGYDISNIGHDDISASMVVFEDGKPKKSAYRLFKIKNTDIQDDYASMRQVLERRFARLEDSKFGQIPQLILVDGGLGHVSSALEVLSAFDTRQDIAILGMVKDSRHRTRGLVDGQGREFNLFGGDKSDKNFGRFENSGDISLEEEDRKNLLRLVSSIQDEAHRFAGNYTRKLSKKRNLKFSLENIPGVGKVRRRALIESFGTMRALSKAEIDEIAGVPGISQKLAGEIYRYLHDKEN